MITDEKRREPADWNMERRIRLVAIDPDGGTIEILED